MEKGQQREQASDLVISFYGLTVETELRSSETAALGVG